MSHIALLIPTVDRIGGAERQVLLLAHGLARRGQRITVVALTGLGGVSADELRSAGIGFVTLGMCKALLDPRGWLRFRRWLLRERPDIVHAHLPHAAWFARASRLIAPIPILIDTIHTTATGTIVRRMGYRFSDPLSDAVTAVSRSVFDAYIAAHMVTPNHFRVIPNGIDLAQWLPDPAARDTVRRELGMGSEFLWLAAGRLEPVKDYPTLLRAFARLQYPSVLTIAGAGPGDSALRRLAHELGIETRVRFLGFQANLARFMQAADGFVLSSRWEGLPVPPPLFLKPRPARFPPSPPPYLARRRSYATAKPDSWHPSPTLKLSPKPCNTSCTCHAKIEARWQSALSNWSLCATVLLMS